MKLILILTIYEGFSVDSVDCQYRYNAFCVSHHPKEYYYCDSFYEDPEGYCWLDENNLLNGSCHNSSKEASCSYSDPCFSCKSKRECKLRSDCSWNSADDTCRSGTGDFSHTNYGCHKGYYYSDGLRTSGCVKCSKLNESVCKLIDFENYVNCYWKNGKCKSGSCSSWAVALDSRNKTIHNILSDYTEDEARKFCHFKGCLLATAEFRCSKMAHWAFILVMILALPIGWIVLCCYCCAHGCGGACTHGCIESCTDCCVPCCCWTCCSACQYSFTGNACCMNCCGCCTCLCCCATLCGPY